MDPAAVADQMTQLDGSAIPGQAGPPPAQPPAPPAQPPAQPPVGGAEYAAYAPTATGFPTQAPPPPAGAPVGPYDPVPGAPYGAPDPGQGYNTGGYNYPQQQPGYSYPGAPVPPKQRNPVMLWGGIIGGVLAIAIVIALVVLLKEPSPSPTPNANDTTSAGPDSNNSPAPGPGGKGAGFNVAWNAPKGANTDGANQMLGVWGTDKYAIRVDSSGIKAYNLTDGKEAWTIPVPAGSKEMCTASYAANSKNIAAVSFNTGDSDCSTVGAVDLAQGKLLWSVKVSADRMSSPTLSVTENVVAIGGNAVGALNIANGQPAWQYQPRDKDCTVRGRTAGAQIAVSDRCYGGSGPKSQLVIVNADTGKAASTPITLTGSIEQVDQVVQDKPLVLLMTNGPQGDYVLPFDKDNKPGTQMSVKEPGSDSLRLSGQDEAITRNVVSGSTLYVQVSGTKPGINAYDLNTGKRLWSATTSSSSNDMRLVSGTDKDGKIRAVVEQGYDKPARLVTLSPTDGSMTDIGTLAMPNSLDIGSSTSEYLISDDGAAVYAFRRYSSSDGPLTKWKK
ncbi:outer membrane protein assembly factor BamB family protein [Streptomyces sp. 1331.2]|uniref:outer membrane protein assembly factor BamB family protein n=1 Tax=Streptomyces sp. 1331.2 TaxID=1938835 RepID=UPI000BD7BD01|nr:PQQ-binding-like beta-propeller repeat protein [Streptomyces sp. 1331.2]SOB81647.1 Outer membrane protein assembly factor BamB, contains PQQ-like beta-propeller repeat [Streptomyces sp. 1331.2]